jgi:hypothetical protein
MPETEFSKYFDKKKIKNLNKNNPGMGYEVWGMRSLMVNYLHSQEILVLLTIMSALASIAMSAASQYSVSAPSDMTLPPISYVTCLQTLHVPSGSHELKVSVISIKDIAIRILRFI